MTDNRLLDLVDRCDFRTLFIDELGWNNPDRPDLSIEVDDDTYTLHQVANYKGLRIWHCPVLPPRKIQRQIDVLVGKDNQERLVIFTDGRRQEWRWPRRAQLGSTNAKLLVHEHLVGDRSTHLAERLQAIELDFDEDLPLVELLDRMRDAFDHEAESASVAAARLMGTLYTYLETAGVGEYDATLLLARLLFLLFGDDADMWEPTGLFERYLRDSTTPEDLDRQLIDLFGALDTPDDQRDLEADSPLAQFRYINGGLFHGPLRLSQLPAGFRDTLLEACEFNWSVISPAVFGSMFQTVKSKEARRHGGEHYTTEENILKTIRPLFLNEYRDRLKRAWDDKGQLTRLHNDLAKLRFLDPACGCGNFLIVAYRELRALELEILKRRRDLDTLDGTSSGGDRAQLTLDVSAEIKVTLDHFYGIEIEEWPARIAETAMLLVDHLANQNMAEEFGVAPDRLPIAIAPTIIHANALHTDWAAVVAPSAHVVIMGNPPFHGPKERSPRETADLQLVWGPEYDGFLDYVAGWYKKATEYFGQTQGQWAFVSTNSVSQGQAVPALWGHVFEMGWRVKFAYRSFPWKTEAPGGAAVHCVIIGFTRSAGEATLIEPSAGGHAVCRIPVPSINAYLVDGPNVLVTKRMRPLSPGLPEVDAGSKAVDWGYLTVEPDDYEAVAADPVAAKYLRPYRGGDELINGDERWCLWFVDADLEELEQSDLIAARLAGVKQKREASPKAATRRIADTPHLFGEIRQPAVDYLGIPQTFTDNRAFATVARLSADVVASIKLFTSPDPDGYLFAMISSSMFMVWQRTVGGRLKSDPSFTNTIVWNTLPLPEVSNTLKQEIIAAGKGIVTARQCHPDWSLAQLYNPVSMPSEVLEAHNRLDLVVDHAFGCAAGPTARKRQEVLFKRYLQLRGRG
ncbi:class I SAM-dependent DNA methyltransferase [Nocardia sp. NPDC004151]|uniref:class I SAM-dependent DNA methyltransferase n=1 Tax=Nocardia sp. NPDC004151 TaxID=3364304 RepID=UPI0036879B34